MTERSTVAIVAVYSPGCSRLEYAFHRTTDDRTVAMLGSYGPGTLLFNSIEYLVSDALLSPDGVSIASIDEIMPNTDLRLTVMYRSGSRILHTLSFNKPVPLQLRMALAKSDYTPNPPMFERFKAEEKGIYNDQW